MNKLNCLWLHRHPWTSAGLMAVAALIPAAHGAGPAPLSGPARPVIEQFLASRTTHLPGRTEIRIDTPASGELPPCDALEAFLPGGVQLRGRVSVGVRCHAVPGWTRYVQAHIAVIGSYLAAARTIEAGQTLAAGDTLLREGDLNSLPASVVLEPSQLVGKVVLNRINTGAPVRREQLRGALQVQQGQLVKLVSRGAGFVVSTEGKALAGAEAGAQVQVITLGGQRVSGTLMSNGTVERIN